MVVKAQKRAQEIDAAFPNDGSISNEQNEKLEKYQGRRGEGQMWWKVNNRTTEGRDPKTRESSAGSFQEQHLRSLHRTAEVLPLVEDSILKKGYRSYLILSQCNEVTHSLAYDSSSLLSGAACTSLCIMTVPM